MTNFSIRIRAGVAIAAMCGTVLFSMAGCSDTNTPEVETGSISGQITEPSGERIEGAEVTATPDAGKASFTTTTDVNGEYTLNDIEVGNYTLHVDASGVVVDEGNSNLQYVDFTANVTVRANQTTTVDSSLPIIDITESVPTNPGEGAILESGGITITIEADATTFPDGSTSGELHLVVVGYNQGPSPVPDGFAPSVMFRILPEGTTFDPPATIEMSNRDEVGVGDGMEVFTYASGDWRSDGRMTSEGEFITGDTAFMADASTHFVVCDATTVTGRISQPEADGVAGADVSVWASVSAFGEGRDWVEVSGRGAVTDANGEFTISDVRACLVGIEASLDETDRIGDLAPDEAWIAVPDGVTDLGDRWMEVHTETQFHVVGNVTDDEGNVVIGGGVDLFEPGSFDVIARTSTDENGNYAFEAIVAAPGSELGIYAYDEGTGFNRDLRFTVPPLRDSGSEVRVDVRVCGDDFQVCGDHGNWDLNGDTMTVVNYEIECGEIVEESQTIDVVALVNGSLTVQFEEEAGQTVQAVFARVQGNGPSSVSASNMTGIYLGEAGSDGEAFLALYADGTFNWLQPEGIEAPVQAGTAVDNGNGTVDVTFLINTELEGPPLGVPMTIEYEIDGDTLTFDPNNEPDTFTRCASSAGSGLEGMWRNDHGDGSGFVLIIYGNEFCGVDRRPDEF